MTNVYGTIQIVAAALHVKNGIPETASFLPTIHMENTDQLCSGQLCSGHWLIEADGHCRQMSVIRLGWLPRGFKLHVMLLFCMYRNHTHLSM